MREPLFIFAAYAFVVLWVLTLYAYNLSGRFLRRKTNASGQDYFFGKRSQGKYAGRIIGVGAPVQGGFVFSIQRRNFWHRFLQRLGLAPGVQAGDQLIDDAFYCMADDEQRLKSLLESSGFGAALREAVQSGQPPRAIYGERNRLWFEVIPDKPREIDEEKLAQQAIGLAQEAAKLAAPEYQASVLPATSRAVLLCRFFHGAVLVLSLVALAALLMGKEELIYPKDLISQAGSVSAVVVLAWGALLILRFGRTSWFPVIGANFLVAGVAALVLLTGVAMWGADVGLDRAPPDVKSVPLWAKECSLYCTTGGKHASRMTYRLTDQQCSVAQAGRTVTDYRARDYRCGYEARLDYTLYFPPPAKNMMEEGAYYEVPAEAKAYAEAQLRALYAFPVHPGYLGLEWIRKADIHPQ